MGFIERLTDHLQRRFPMTPRKFSILCALWVLSCVGGLGMNLTFMQGRVYPMIWVLGLAESGDKKSAVFNYCVDNFIKPLMAMGSDSGSAKGIVKEVKDNCYKRTTRQGVEYSLYPCAPDEYTAVLKDMKQDWNEGYEQAMVKLKDFKAMSRVLSGGPPIETPRTFIPIGAFAVRETFVETLEPSNVYSGWFPRMVVGVDTSKDYHGREKVDPNLDAERDAFRQELQQWMNDCGDKETTLTFEYWAERELEKVGKKYFRLSRKSNVSMGAVYSRAEENLLILVQLCWMSERMANPSPPCYYVTDDKIQLQFFKQVCKIYAPFLADSIYVCTMLDGDVDVKKVRRTLARRRAWMNRSDLLRQFGFISNRLDAALSVLKTNGEVEEVEEAEKDSQKKTTWYRLVKR